MARVQVIATGRLRGPCLAVLVRSLHGVPFEEGLRLADERNLVIASSAMLNRMEPGGDKKVRFALACWSGTNTAYIEPDIPFDERSLLVINDNELERRAGTRYFVDVVDERTKEHRLFPVHPKHLGEKNSILVAEHPNYISVTDAGRIITLPAGMSLEEAVVLVRDFPKESGSYGGDLRDGIPVLSQSNPRCFLWRTHKRVGPAAYGKEIDVTDLGFVSGVNLESQPSEPLGVLVESPDWGSAVSMPLVVISQLQSLGLERKGFSTLIVRGDSRQLDGVVQLLKSLTDYD